MAKKAQPQPEPRKGHEGGSLMAELLRAQGFEGTEAPPAPAPAGKSDTIDLNKTGKIVVRRERKGRGGKTVTVISGIERSPADLARIAQAMRKALGCGSTVEGNTIVLQGDIVPRAQAWLQAHGATKIVQGS